MRATATTGGPSRSPEVGRRLDVSRATAYRLVASGELPSVRLGRRRVVPLAVIERKLVDALGGAPTGTVGASASGGLVSLDSGDEGSAPC
jgi:excisionase family DNA binding protein